MWFPPPYEPHGVNMLYDGKPVTLSPASEEVATFFATVLGTQHAENATFCQNFFKDFKRILSKYDPSCPIREFQKCDFTPILRWIEEQRERKKQLSKEEKKVFFSCCYQECTNALILFLD